MKYVKSREQFLKVNESKKINEVLENEINWGDSLLGRLINSTLRRTKLAYRGKRTIPLIIDNLRVLFGNLKELPADSEKMELIKVFTALDKLEKYIEANNSTSKIDDIIKESNNTIEEIKSIDFKQKKEVIENIKKFIDELNNTNNPDNDNSNNLADIVNRLKNNNYFLYPSTKLKLDILKKDIKSLNKIKNNFQNKEESEIEAILQDQIDDTRQRIKDNDPDIITDDLIKRVKQYLSPVNSRLPGKKLASGKEIWSINYDPKTKDIIYTYNTGTEKTINIFELFKSSEAAISNIVKEGLIVELNSSIDILSRFKDIVQPNRYEISESDKRELDEKYRKNTPDKISHESVIEILKNFNRAYKLYTTEEIPSGRSAGKVSTKTRLEYTKRADNLYVNNYLFDKFEKGVFDILKDYGDLFSKKVKVGKGNGAVLSKFINELLSGDAKLYNKGAQYNFMNEYFGIDVKSSGLDDSDNSVYRNTKSDDKSKNPEKKTADFKEQRNIEDLKKGFYAIVDSNNTSFLFIDRVLKDDSDNKYYLGKLTKNIDSYKNYIPNTVIEKNNASLRYGKKEEGDLDITLFKLDSNRIDGYKKNIKLFKEDPSSKIEELKIENFSLYELLDNKNNELIQPVSSFDKERVKSDISLSSKDITKLIDVLKEKYNIRR